MITCEIRITRPRYTFINVGTNDGAFMLPTGSEGVARVSDLVRQVRFSSSIPILSTLPPHVKQEGDASTLVAMNRAIVAAAQKLRVPVINVWRAMMRPSMINFGMEPGDGLHLATLGGIADPGALRRSVDLRPAALRYGNNLRNLLILKTLRRLDRLAGVRYGHMARSTRLPRR